MYLLLRVLVVIAKACFRPKVKVLDRTETEFHVRPTDVDLNFHMNNGRYLSLMDLARLDYVVRTGLMRIILRNKWRPMVGAATIRFKRGLSTFQKFSISVRIVGWDSKWIYMEQTFESERMGYAVGWLKVLFRGRDGNVPTVELLRTMGIQQDDVKPEPSEGFRAWLGAVDEMPI
jgi:acyl-CoA thioesterase FadM